MAYVYPDGIVPTVVDDGVKVPVVGTDHTIRIEIDEDGTRTIAPGQTCYSDGRPHDERRVQILAERDAYLQFVFFDRTVTLDGQSTARFERAA